MIAARTAGTDLHILFTFHGTGGTERQFHAIGERLRPGFHVVSPRGEVSENGSLRFFRRTGEGIFDMDDLRERTEVMANFMLREVGDVDAHFRVGLGYSNGANILANVLLTRPEAVDVAVLLHPLIPFEPAPVDLGGKRVLVTAGRRDPICPPALTQALADRLRAFGAEVTLMWHEGGHEIAPGEWEAVSAFR